MRMRKSKLLSGIRIYFRKEKRKLRLVMQNLSHFWNLNRVVHHENHDHPKISELRNNLLIQCDAVTTLTQSVLPNCCILYIPPTRKRTHCHSITANIQNPCLYYHFYFPVLSNDKSSFGRESFKCFLLLNVREKSRKRLGIKK